MRATRTWTAALLIFSLTPFNAWAQDSARSFYQGRTVQFLTMGGPGGGYDAYTRGLADQMEKRLGAKVVTVNEPGAGGLIAMNNLMASKPDATTLLLIGGEGITLATLMGEPGVNFDLLKQTWLGRVSAENKVLLLGPKAPYRTLAEMAKTDRPFVWVGSGKTDGNTDFQALLSYALGMKTKIVVGYKGTEGMNLALENGEADGRVVSDESAAMLGPSTGMRVIAVLAPKRVEQFPDTPTIFEAAKIDPAAADLLDWRAGIAALGRVIAVTPGSPPDRVALLRAALAESLADPQFVADMKKYSLTVNYAPGEDVEGMMKRALTTVDSKRLAELKDIIINRYY